MKPIPQELIDRMPSEVDANKESCQAAADATLLVLFIMGEQLEPKLEWPPIISNGHELWPLPAPWGQHERNQVKLLADLNGAGDQGYLEHCRRNALEYNEALDAAMPDVAIEIAKMGPRDAAHIWEYLNALAVSVEDEAVYRPLELSAETKQAFYQAKGLGS